MREKISGIYLIRNKITNNLYVGQSVNIYQRWSNHKSLLNSGKGSSIYLQRAWTLYGKDSFEFTVLCYCEPIVEKLCLAEQYYMDLLTPEYNLCPAAGSTLGMPCSPEHREKIKNGNLGKIRTAKTKQKLKAAQLEITKQIELGNLPPRIQSPEARLARSERCRGSKPAGLTMAGKQHSEETRAKMSASQAGKPVSEEARKKISEKLTGVPLSEERKSNMRKAPRPKQSAEQIAKRVAARKATLASRKLD
jgi:group I intron endonuclease